MTSAFLRLDDEISKINSIVTKRLSSDDVEVVDEAMATLCDLLHSSKNNVDENRKYAAFCGALGAILFAMLRNEHSVSILANGLMALANISLCGGANNASGYMISNQTSWQRVASNIAFG
jgi:hypothetical protein